MHVIGLVNDDYVGGVTIKWRCNTEGGEEVVADKWYDIGEGDRSRRHKGSMVNKLWRRNTGESLLSNGEHLGQVQCQVNWKADAIIGYPLIFNLVLIVSLWPFTYCYGDIVT